MNLEQFVKDNRKDMEALVSNLDFSQSNDISLPIGLGESLFLMLEETKEEKYKNAISVLAQQCAKLPRNNQGIFSVSEEKNQVDYDDLYSIMPFYMKYDTTYNKKERYNDIIAQFMALRNSYFREETQLYVVSNDNLALSGTENSAKLLATLVDTIANTSEEIYEQYKKLFVLFKENLRGVLKYQAPGTLLIYEDEDSNQVNVPTSLLTLYAMKKACKLGVLLSEKYEDMIETMLTSLEPMLKETSDSKIDGLWTKIVAMQ